MSNQIRMPDVLSTNLISITFDSWEWRSCPFHTHNCEIFHTVAVHCRLYSFPFIMLQFNPHWNRGRAETKKKKFYCQFIWICFQKNPTLSWESFFIYNVDRSQNRCFTWENIKIKQLRPDPLGWLNSATAWPFGTPCL